MKILAVSDLHFGLKQFDWVHLNAELYDMVIIAGDLLDIAGHLDLDSQIIIIAKYLQTISAKKQLLVCSGNHDGDSKNEHEEYIAAWLGKVRAAGLVVDGSSHFAGDTLFSVCPWWDGPKSQEALQAFLRSEAKKRVGPWIWIHHAPPDGVPVSWTGKGYAGDTCLTALIEELSPDLIFSGHIHNSPFQNGGSWASRVGNTWIFNSGRQLGAPPAFITVDLEKRVAHWSSQAGEEELHFSDPAAAPVVLQ